MAALAASGVVGVVWQIALDPRLRMTIEQVERLEVRHIRQALAVIAALDEHEIRAAARRGHDIAAARALQRMHGR